MEKMKYITFLNITARLIFTIFIFVLVRQSGDYLLVPFLNSLGYLTAGAISFWIIYRRFSVGISLKHIRVSTIGLYMKEGLFVFLSISSSTLLYRSSVLFIGLLMGYAEVAFYSAAEKIVTALKNIIMVINQTVFPRLSRQADENTAEYYRAWKKVGRINIAVALLLFAGLIFFANNIVAVLFSEKFIESAWIVRLLSVSIISYAVMTVLGLLGMLVLGYTKELSFSQIFPSLAFIILSPVILKFLSLQTYIVFFLLTEAAIIMHRVIYLRKINFCGWGAR